jgi:hypothetical protein
MQLLELLVQSFQCFFSSPFFFLHLLMLVPHFL